MREPDQLRRQFPFDVEALLRPFISNSLREPDQLPRQCRYRACAPTVFPFEVQPFTGSGSRHRAFFTCLKVLAVNSKFHSWQRSLLLVYLVSLTYYDLACSCRRLPPVLDDQASSCPPFALAAFASNFRRLGLLLPPTVPNSLRFCVYTIAPFGNLLRKKFDQLVLLLVLARWFTSASRASALVHVSIGNLPAVV